MGGERLGGVENLWQRGLVFNWAFWRCENRPSALAPSQKSSIPDFSTWPLLNQFQTARDSHGSNAPVKPDGLLRIHEREAGMKGFALDS